jgi:hypothetical protein
VIDFDFFKSRSNKLQPRSGFAVYGISNDRMESTRRHLQRNFVSIRPRKWTEHPFDRLSLSLQNKDSNEERNSKRVFQEDEKSVVISSSNSIRKTYGQLSNAPSSAVDSSRREPLLETATPKHDDFGPLSRQVFVKKLAIAALCAAILDFAVRADWSADNRPAHVVHAKYAKKESPERPAQHPTGAPAPGTGALPVVAAIAQASGGAVLLLGGALLSLLEASIPFLATNVASPAAAKLAHLSAGVLPSAEQLAASASAGFPPAASLPSSVELPDGVRAALAQALIPVSEQAAAAAAAADAALRAAGEALVGQAAQAPPHSPARAPPSTSAPIFCPTVASPCARRG